MSSKKARMLILILLLSLTMTMTAFSGTEKVLELPVELTVISEEAFMGDTSITEVIIPETVQKIERDAFSGCFNLEKIKVYSRTVQIEADAFYSCPNICLYVYEGSTSEAYAQKYGLSYVLLDGSTDNRPTYLKVKSMIGEFSSSGTGLQGGDDRLIVRMNGVPLPDIASYHPLEMIVDDRDTYFIQFGSETDAVNCKSMFEERSDVLFVEYDAVSYVSNRGEDSTTVSQAGIMTWEDDDPMGFDVYAPYVTMHQSGSQMIAIIDTGVKYNAVYADMLSPKSINLLDDGQSAFYSGRQHATNIAGIIHDCVGSTNISILSIRAVDDNEQTDSILFGQSIAYAVDSGADIINISYLFPYSSYVEDEIRYAVSKGRKVVISAGNQNGSTSDVFPANANVDDLIIVSGLDDGNQLWARTNTGKEVTYCAPASGIRTSIGNVGTGTSFAAPMIASAYALVGLDTTHTIRDMRNTCKTDISVGNHTQAIGYGMPQLHKLAAVKVQEIVTGSIPSTMKVGDSFKLSYSVLPEKALDRTVSAVSGNTSVLTIENGTGENFILRGVGKGKSTVTITANDGSGISTSFDVQVLQPVTGITISADKYEIGLQDTLALTLNAIPENANNKEVFWSSSAPEVATISQTGVVTPVSAGTTVIRAEAKDGSGAHHEVTIKIVDIPDPVSIDIIVDGKTIGDNDAIMLQPGEGIHLSAKVYPEKAEQSVTWSVKSIPANIASVDATGYLKGIKSGSAFVTAISTADATIRREAGVIIQVMPERITLTGTNEVNVGDIVTIGATVEPSNTTNKNIIWSSENTGIASVDQNGVVTGVAGGEVNIVAKSEADSTIFQRKHIVVKQLPESVSISGRVQLFINNDDPAHPAQNASRLAALVSPANTYDKTVTWTSSDTSVVTINNEGLLETVTPGTAEITVQCNADETVCSTVTVTVKNQWSDWSAWSDTSVSETDDNQVERRTMYKSTTTSYGGWGNWSGYDLTARSGSDTMEVHSAPVYMWNYNRCPYCGVHMWGYGYNCARWAGGCGNALTASNQNWVIRYFEDSHVSGEQNWENTNQIRKVINGEVYFANQNNHSAMTGYQYRTRSKNVTQSGWQTVPIAPVNTNDRIVQVDTKVQYRYRIKNKF